MQQNRESIRRQGLGLAAISYDPRPVLESFAARKGITFPLLSDPQSRIIHAFGVFNEAVPEGTTFRGIPRPGTFLVDHDGTVTAKFFEDDFRERFTAGDILVRRFGAGAGAARSEIETPHLRIAAGASNAAVREGQRIALALEVALKPRMHVYATGVAGGYYPVEWRMADSGEARAHEVEWPHPIQLHLPVIGETVPVYEGTFRLTRDVTIGKVPPGELTLKGTLRYQACDDKACYAPRTVPLEWRLRVDYPDLQRFTAPGATPPGPIRK